MRDAHDELMARAAGGDRGAWAVVERPASSIAGIGTIALALALYAVRARAGNPAPAAAALVQPEGDP